MPRRTKIVATIGPASDSPATLRKMMEAGMDVARIGLAHGSLDEALERYRTIRSAAQDVDRYIGIMVDLPGPKVRLAAFEESTHLSTGSTVHLAPLRERSDALVLGVDYERLLLDVHAGDCLAVGDGSITLQIDSVGATMPLRR